MRVWRLSLGRYGATDGEGARLYGGRWNSPGIPAVYAATHISLALLEQLVHVSLERIPTEFRAFAIDLPEGAPVETAAGDVRPGDADAARRYGDTWAVSLRSAALIVASVLVPALLEPGGIERCERNVILNPRHPSAAAWRVVETSFRIDRRLQRIAGT